MKTLVALVGTKFRGPEMIALLASLPQGEPLELVREPNNRYDSGAVQVWARSQHIGYVKASQALPVRIALDAAIMQAGLPPDQVRKPAKLAVDGGKWPMIELEV